MFVSSAILLTNGSQQTLTATDTSNGSITGSETVTVTTATQFHISASSSGTAGTGFTVTVTAENASNSLVNNYLGTVQFTTSDSGGTDAVQAITFTGSPTGGIFTLAFSGHTTGNISYSTTATALASNIQSALNALTGIGAGNTAVSASSASSVNVTFQGTLARAMQTTMSPGNGLSGGSSPGLSVATTRAGVGPLLPANYTFTAGDSGTHTFTSGITLITAATQTVSVTDTGNSAITGNAVVTVSAGAAATLSITAPATAAKSTAFTVTVTALDSYGNTASGYTGVVQFTKSDSGSGAAVPSNYTFVSGDHGVHTFTNDTTLVTSGNQTVTAADTVTGTITGNAVFAVTDATHFQVSLPSTSVAGAGMTVTVTALQAGGATATDYTGTVHFSSSDTNLAVSLPPDYQFTAADDGVYVFTSGVGLITAGSQTVTASDAGNTHMSGSQAVSVSPGAATRFSVSGPASATAGSSFNVTVTALDSFGNLATGYYGAVNFSGAAAMTYPYYFVPADSGVHTFSGIAFSTAGFQTVAATDTVTSSITGSLQVTVSAASATHFTLTGAGKAGSNAPVTLTLTAFDTNGNIATGYTGTAHFTTTDSGSVDAVQTITFTGSPTNGSFTLIFAGHTTGAISYTTTSTALASNIQSALNALTGIIGSGNSAVSASSATNVTVTFQGSLAGEAQPTMAAATNSLTGGTNPALAVATTQAGGSVVVPANYTFTAADQGVHVFTGGVTLITTSTETVTATDVSNGSITGSVALSVITATHFTVVASTSATAGTAFTVTVTALNASGGTATGYTGTVHFATSDSGGAVSLPANYTFVSGDSGVHTFTSGVKQVTVGGQSVTVTDTGDSGITGTAAVTVNPALAASFEIAAPALAE